MKDDREANSWQTEPFFPSAKGLPLMVQYRYVARGFTRAIRRDEAPPLS
jgi:hypothetical protein